MRIGFLLVLQVLLQTYSFAQPGSLRRDDQLVMRYADTTRRSFDPGKPYYITRWNDYTRKIIEPVRVLSEGLAIVAIPGQNFLDVYQEQFQILPAGDSWKLSPSLEFIQNEKGPVPGKLLVSGKNISILLNALQSGKYLRIIRADSVNNTVVVALKTPAALEKLAALKEVIFIDMVVGAHTEIGIIGYDRSMHGITALDHLIPGANGENKVVGVKEQQMEITDLDLHRRVLSSTIAATNTEMHATVISSIIGGAGNSFYDGRGIANHCRFFPSSFANLFPDDAGLLNANKVTVQNHSYGTIVQQFYGAEALAYDAQTWANPNLLHVFSAGNRGASSANEGRYANLPGYANLTGNFKMAKNIITVAATDNNGTVAAESSSGPVYDGRIAPQLAALGPNGTSDAAAMVSGTVAVMQQVFADSNGQQLPAAALVKAILYNTAGEIYLTGIDYKTGYGLLDSYAAVRAVQQKKYITGVVSPTQTWTHNITVPSGAANIKLTLAWTDTAATLNNPRALIKDIDLELVETSSGISYKPWVLNTTANADSLVRPATRKRDSLNTAEQVNIELPNAGDYQIRVSYPGTGTIPVNFAIAWNVDTLHTFQFISPQHTSDVNRYENPELSIRWKTFVADTNEAGDLSISYDRGANWQAIKQAQKLYTNRFNWTIKDTSSVARLKMETAFGTFFSNEFIISKVISPVVDFACADSVRFSWNKHIYASSYQLFMLIDSPYLKPFMNVTDTFVVLKRAVYPSQVYAVEPVLSNNIPASRSVAFNVDLQGVDCFYRTLNYQLLNGNRLNMTVELSGLVYIDSVFFEQVTATGVLLQTYGGVKVNQANSIYSKIVDDLATGITYLRGRVKLKNGAIVYTNIVAALTAGPKPFLLYPNPAARNEPVRYILQEGIAADCQLAIIDVFGKTIRSYSSIPTSLNVTSLPAGVYFLKLIDRNNRLIGTEKLILQ